MDSRQKKNLKVVIPCLAAVGVMCAAVANSPTIYRLFCSATGYNGTTQRVSSDTAKTSTKTITVIFDSNVAPGLPWRFEPLQRSVTVHLGAKQLVYFRAENDGDKAMVAHATFNVTPARSGIYFNKIQCFCFTEERLDAHQKVDMPVVFYVDPAFGTDPDMRDVATITLGYTFFRSANPQDAKNLSRFLPNAPPDVAYGKQLFAERCTACHALTENKFGPMLGGVVGRRAGSAPGYNYSTALKDAGFVWSPEKLNHWLENPRGYIPGVKMPIRVLEQSSRKDLIGYLESVSEGNMHRVEAKPAAHGSGS